MTAHTPGPWHVVSTGTLAFVAQQADDDGRFALASVAFPTFHPDGLAAARGEQAANARLIAAAPDLLAALADLIGCAEPHRDRVEIKAARRAIKKARGEA